MTATTKSKITQIAKALKIDELPLHNQDELTIHLNSIIFRSALVRFLERLPEKERATYKSLIDAGATVEECAAFLRTHKKKMDSSVEEAVNELADDILVGTA